MKTERENVRNNPHELHQLELSGACSRATRHTSTGGTAECRAFVLGPLAGGERWSLATDRPKWTTVVECSDLLLSEGSTDDTVPAILYQQKSILGMLCVAIRQFDPRV
jgi:hypothetical protein